MTVAQNACYVLPHLGKATRTKKTHILSDSRSVRTPRESVCFEMTVTGAGEGLTTKKSVIQTRQCHRTARMFVNNSSLMCAKSPRGVLLGTNANGNGAPDNDRAGRQPSTTSAELTSQPCGPQSERARGDYIDKRSGNRMAERVRQHTT